MQVQSLADTLQKYYVIVWNKLINKAAYYDKVSSLILSGMAEVIV